MFGVARKMTKEEAQRRREHVEAHYKSFEFCAQNKAVLNRIIEGGPRPGDEEAIRMGLAYALWMLRWHEKTEEIYD